MSEVHGHDGDCTPLDCPHYEVDPVESTPGWDVLQKEKGDG